MINKLDYKLYFLLFFFALSSCTKDDSVENDTIDISGVWKIDLTLGSGRCDETLLEDEMNIPPTFRFNSNGTLTFVTDPVDIGLNDNGFSNTYTISGNKLTIKSYYTDGSDNIKLDAILTYNPTTKKFTGTYTNNWGDGTICPNNLEVYK